MPDILFYILIVLAVIGVLTILFGIAALILMPFNIADSLDRLDKGQDEEIDLLIEIRDELKKK